MNTLTRTIALLSLSTVLAACDNDNSNDADPINPPEPKTFSQVDRMGIPATATLFVDTLGTRTDSASDAKNSFNAGTPANGGDFSAGIEGILTALRTLDENPDNDVGGTQDTTDPSIPRVSVATTTAVVSPDVLTINLDGSVAGLLTVELGVTDAFGGRTLSEDVGDAALSVIVFPAGGDRFVSDYVDQSDVMAQSQFPYFGAAH